MLGLSYTDVAALTDGDFKKICQSLPEERLKKVEGLANYKDKLLSAAAGYLLQAALTDRGITDPGFVYGKCGKPYLKSGEIFFNLSHSGNVAVCAVSTEEVGVDAQEVKPVDDKLIRRICTDREYAFITEDKAQIRERFCRVWTVKESLIKCLGRGLSLSPARIEVELGSGVKAFVDGVACNLYFKEYALAGYRITACSPVDGFTPELRKVVLR